MYIVYTHSSLDCLLLPSATFHLIGWKLYEGEQRKETDNRKHLVLGVFVRVGVFACRCTMSSSMENKFEDSNIEKKNGGEWRMNGAKRHCVIPMPHAITPENNGSDEQTSLYKNQEQSKENLRPIAYVNAKKNEYKEHWVYSSVTRTIMALLLLLTAVNFDMFVLAVIHDRVPSTPPLPDLIFDLLPKVDSALNISEVIIIVTTSLMLLMIILHRYSWIVLRRLMLIMSILYIFRGITMAVTQVPVANPQYYCSPKTNFTAEAHFRVWPYIQTIFERVNHMSIGMGLSINGRHTFCGDYIFSGHTIIILLSKS